MDTLADIRKQYEEEMLELEARLMELAREAMGDTPINLSSPDDRSVIVLRRVRDKKEWARMFNLGHDAWLDHEAQERTRMSENEFRGIVRRHTDVVYRTRGECVRSATVQAAYKASARTAVRARLCGCGGAWCVPHVYGQSGWLQDRATQLV